MSVAVERRRSFWLASCFVLARGRMATDGSPPGSTVTLTLDTSTSSRAVVDESIVTWKEYCPGGSELAGTAYEHPLVGVVRKGCAARNGRARRVKTQRSCVVCDA